MRTGRAGPKKKAPLIFRTGACHSAAMQVYSHSHIPTPGLTQPSQYYHLVVCNRNFQAWAQRPWQTGAHCRTRPDPRHAGGGARECHNSFSGVAHVVECLVQHWMWAVAIVPVPARKAQLLLHLHAHASRGRHPCQVQLMELFWAGGSVPGTVAAGAPAACMAVEAWRDVAWRLVRNRYWKGLRGFRARVQRARGRVRRRGRRAAARGRGRRPRGRPGGGAPPSPPASRVAAPLGSGRGAHPGVAPRPGRARGRVPPPPPGPRRARAGPPPGRGGRGGHACGAGGPPLCASAAWARLVGGVRAVERAARRQAQRATRAGVARARGAPSVPIMRGTAGAAVRARPPAPVGAPPGGGAHASTCWRARCAGRRR